MNVVIVIYTHIVASHYEPDSISISHCEDMRYVRKLSLASELLLSHQR